MAINAQTLQGQWNQLKGDVKKKWGQLSDDDLRWSSGGVDQLIGRIQERTGEKKEVIEKFFTQLTDQGASALSGAVETVGHAASDATNRLREGYTHLSEEARDQYGNARELVVRNPMQWVGAAFGIGFLAGMIVGFTSHSSQPQPRRFF